MNVPKCPHCGGKLASDSYEFKGLRFEDNIVYFQDRAYHFTACEYKILEAFAIAQGRVVTREFIYNLLYWDRANDGPDLKLLDVFMVKIRRKLKTWELPVEILTIWGRGWQWVVK